MGIDYRHPRRHSPAPGSPSAPPSAPNPGWSQIESIRAEWPKNSLDAVADLRNYQQALALYDRDDYPAMMQCATWFATALAHSLYGDGVLRGDDLPNTVHKTLYCALSAPPDGQTFADGARRAARLALTIMRENGWHPPAFGGTIPFFEPLLTDTGNRMLLSAAIAPPGEPWKGDLRAFFAVPPAPPARSLTDADDPVALFNLAVQAAQANDVQRAGQLFQRAAEAGNADGYAALTELARDAGDNDAESHWARLGAEAGHTFCMTRHGLLLAKFANGDVPTMQRARIYLEQASERGDIDAMGLAVSINQQLGDPGRAHRFVDMVIRSGNREAIDRLRRYGLA